MHSILTATMPDEYLKPLVSTSPRLRILNRGDFIGALNCLLPELDLRVDTASTNAGRTIPVLDPNFSMFSGIALSFIGSA